MEIREIFVWFYLLTRIYLNRLLVLLATFFCYFQKMFCTPKRPNASLVQTERRHIVDACNFPIIIIELINRGKHEVTRAYYNVCKQRGRRAQQY